MAGTGIENKISLEGIRDWNGPVGGFLEAMGSHLSWAVLQGKFILPGQRNHYARIAGFPICLGRVDQIVQHATASRAFGIETDNDIRERYESFLDPTPKLKTIKAVPKKGT